jgi:hypothetical protein
MATGPFKNKAFKLVQVGKQTEADTRQQVLAISFEVWVGKLKVECGST